MTEKRKLRVLVVEDSSDDVLLLVRELRRGGYDPSYEVVETGPAMQAALSRGGFDLVLSDYSMPSFSGPAALTVLRENGSDLPFIIVSGTIGEETAVDALKAGAHDFLVKGRLARLIPAIERTLREVSVARERRRAEEALQKSERKYRQIVETAREGVWVFDAAATTTYANRRMADMLGVAPDAMIGSSLLDFVPPSSRGDVLESLERRRQGIAEQAELLLRRTDGSEFWAVLSTTPIHDDDGRWTGALAMVTDVTEQRQLQAYVMAADRLASVGTLAAGVAHEINNPLAAVTVNLDLALADLEAGLDRPDAAQTLLEELRDARSAADRVRAIVHDRSSSPVETTKAGGPWTSGRYSTRRYGSHRNEIRHRAKVTKRYEPVPHVAASESRLGQVFLNLLVNAAHAIPEGRAERSEISLATSVHADGRVVVEIRDTGSGMGPEVLSRLFTPFFTTKPVGVGTGLGLSICHRIVSSLGGEISVESVVNEGTRFRVILPPAPAGLVPDLTAVHAPVNARRRGRVLIVDDEPIVANAVRRTLHLEHDVVVALEAAEALALLTAGERFDVILCDLMMPRLSGMDLFAEVTRIAPEQAQRMIFMSGGAFTASARQFLDEVPNARFEKPFDPARLRTIVNERVV